MVVGQRGQQVWEIVGGQDVGGVLVRSGPELSSAKCPFRLAHGARVLEMGLWDDRTAGQRLHFLLLSGEGPPEGWISVSLNCKLLAKRVENPMPSVQPQLLRRTDTSFNISGRWTMTSLQTGFASYFLMKQKQGRSTFSGRQLETHTDIADGRIEAGIVHWRINNFKVEGRLADGGKRMDDVKVLHIESGYPCGLYIGTWDPGKDKYMVDNSLLQAGGSGLNYRKSKDLADVDPTSTAAWGTVVVGIDEGDGWVKVVDTYLPKEIDGKAVLRDPNAPAAPVHAPRSRREAKPVARGTRSSQESPRDPFAAPEHLLGCFVPGVSKLARAQVVTLQKELAYAYADASFQQALRSAWEAAKGSSAQQAEAVKRTCSKAYTSAMSKRQCYSQEEQNEEISQEDHLQSIVSDSELCCYALLLKWLLDPALQVLCSTSSASTASPPCSDEEEFEVLLTDPGDEIAIRGIGKCRAEFARAHKDMYRAFYPGMLHNEWLAVLGRESTETYLERGVIMMHAESLVTGEVAGYISCRCEEQSVVISHIGVLPQHQGKGLGRMLFQHLLQHLAKAAPAASEILEMNVVELNTRAVSWYRRLGFAIVNIWTRSFSAKCHRVPVVFLTMRRTSGAAVPVSGLFGRNICGSKVAVLPEEAPGPFLDAVARQRWPWLSTVAVARFESDTQLHELQDGRRVDLSLEFSLGRAVFDHPLHTVLSS